MYVLRIVRDANSLCAQGTARGHHLRCLSSRARPMGNERGDPPWIEPPASCTTTMASCVTWRYSPIASRWL